MDRKMKPEEKMRGEGGMNITCFVLVLFVCWFELLVFVVKFHIVGRMRSD